MKGRLLALLAPLVLAASAGLWYYVAVRERPAPAACPGLTGAETLPAETIVLIDGPAEIAARAAAALGCAAAAEGAQLVYLSAPAPAAALTAELRTLRQAEARVQTLQTPIAASPDDHAAIQSAGEARAETIAAAIARTPRESLRIAALDQPDASRAQVGVAGHTWRPPGARLPADETISLRAEASATPGMRIKLRPFEDVPLHGAAMRYDGLIEVGPDSSSQQLRGR